MSFVWSSAKPLLNIRLAYGPFTPLSYNTKPQNSTSKGENESKRRRSCDNTGIRTRAQPQVQVAQPLISKLLLVFSTSERRLTSFPQPADQQKQTI